MSPPPSPIRTAPRHDDAREWLSVGPASRLVGVGPDTLRRWGDEGRLPTFTTPGGHRRFERRDLERVLVSRQAAPARRRLTALGATPARLSRAYARSYRAAEDGRSRVASRFDRPVRDAFRSDGRRILAALLAYLDASSARTRARSETEAVDAVRATAERLAAAGASMDEAAAAFIAARRPFLAELGSLGRRRSLDVASLSALYEEAVALLDQLLLEFLGAFTSPTSSPQGVPE